MTDTPLHPGNGRSFYSARVGEFLSADASAILGRLSSRHVAFHQSAEAEQIRAWEREIEILKTALNELGSLAVNWWLLIEVPLLRLGKRLDTVLLAPGVVCVVEFKIGATSYEAQARLQTERYAQSLKDFHEISQTQCIIPVLCAEKAERRSLTFSVVDGVAGLVFANSASLTDALRLVAKNSVVGGSNADGHVFDLSPYRPTPTIVEAAQKLYAGHEIADIGRGDAADAELQAAADMHRVR